MHRLLFYRSYSQARTIIHMVGHVVGLSRFSSAEVLLITASYQLLGGRGGVHLGEGLKDKEERAVPPLCRSFGSR
jgi:hypothetical protein